MNHIYKMVFNKRRGALVAVSEATTNAAQAEGPALTGTTVGTVKRTFKASFAALAVSAAFVTAPALAAVDYTEQWDNDFPSASVTTYENYTVNSGVTVTVNKGIDEGSGNYLVNPNASFTVNKVLTNKGTIANDKKDMPWTIKGSLNNQANAAFAAGTVTFTAGTGTIINNAGAIDFGQLVGAGDITNAATGSIKLAQSYTLTGTLTNAGSLDLKGLDVATGSTLANTAASGVTVGTLTVTGAVSGDTGVIDITEDITVNENATFKQKSVNIAADGSNAGSMTVENLNLKNKAGTFTNAATGVLSVTGGLDVADGKTLTNAGEVTGAAVTIGGTGKIENAGTKFETTSVTVANTGSFKNTAETGTKVGTLTVNGGKVEGTGAMEVTTDLTTAAGTEFTQATVDAKGTLNVAGTYNITKKLTTTGKAAFAAGATGTVANADVNGELEHAGSMVFTAMDAAGNVKNTAGTLRIDALTGTGVITNTDNATLDMSRGTNAAVSITNAGTATINDTTLTGALTNNGGRLTGTGTVTVATTTNAAQATLENLVTGALTASGETNVTGKLTGSATADFEAGATGTIAEADITGNITHAGNQVFTKLTNSAEIKNNGGTLTVATLEGASAIANADGATLAFANGTQNAASLTNAGTANLGTFTATGDITNTKAVTSTGLVTAVNYTQTGDTATTNVVSLTATTALNTAGTFTATGKVTAAEGTNTGTMSTGDLTVTTSFTNSKSLTSTGAADITNFKQTGADATAVFNTAVLKGAGDFAGTVTGNGAVTFDAGSTYTGTGSIDAKADLNVNGNVTLTGNVTAAGATNVAANQTLQANALTLKGVNIAGNLVNGGTSTVEDLNMSEGAKLTTTGALTVAKGTAVDKVTYEQSGDGSITFSDGKWFSNSTINVFGGSLARGADGLGEGNTYVIKRDGAADITDTNGIVGSDWTAGRTLVSVDTLDIANSVTLQAGGVLDVDTISFTTENGQTKYLTFAGGALSTTLDQIFTDVASDALDMEAMNSETGRIEIKGNAVGLTSVGAIKDGVKAHTDFTTGGDIVFTDSAISVDLVSAVNSRLAAAGGTDITVHYTGQTAQVFDADVANRVIDNNTDVKAIFDTSTLYAQNTVNPTGGKTLHLGTTEIADTTNIKGSIGFRNVANTERVKITDGLTFALVGDVGAGNLIGTTGGTVEVSGAGSTFMLGTLGRSEALTGTVAKVTLAEGGRLFGKGQSYTITEVDAQNGTVQTDAAGALNATTLKLGASGVLTNAGAMNVTTWNDVTGATATNSGALNVKNAATVAGTLTTEAGSSTIFTNKLTVSGKVTNKSQGRAQGMQIAALDVTANDAFVNEGNLLVQGATNILAGGTSASSNVSAYAFTNARGGVADLSAGKLTIGGVTTVMTTAEPGVDTDSPIFAAVKNEGTLKLGQAEIKAGSQLHNASGGTVTATNLTVGAGALFWNKTDGTLNADTFTANGSVRNFGTMNVQNGDFAGSAIQTTNSGVMNFALFRLAAGAMFTNTKATAVEDGTITGKDTVNTNETGATAEYNKLTVSDGAQYANKGTLKVNDALTVTGAGTRLTNSNTGTVAKAVTLTEGAVLEQTAGSFTGDSLALTNSSLAVKGGTFSVANGVTFTSGTISYNGTGATDPVTGSLAINGEIGGTIAVESASLALTKYTTTPAAKTAAEVKLPDAKHIFSAGYAPLDLGAKGKLAVGAGAETKATSLTKGSVWFGADSLFVIDTTTGMTKVEGAAAAGTTTIAALTGTGSLTIDTGAKLHVKNIGLGTYYVTKDFANETLGTGSWQDLVTYDPEESGKFVEVTQDKDGNVLITAGVDPTFSLPETALPGTMIEVVGNPNNRDPNGPGASGFINTVVEAFSDAKDQDKLVDTINNAVQVGAAGGLYAQNLTLTGNVLDATENHLSYEDVHFVNGEERLWEGARLWVNTLGQTTDVSGLAMTGTTASFDGMNYGVMVGLDLAETNGLRWGAAFAAQKGSVNSNGSIVKTENETDAYSLTAYAAKKFGGLNVIGHLGYTHTESSLSQVFGGVTASQSLEAGNDILTAGLKAEYRFRLTNSLAVVPYAGVRSLTFLSSDETSDINGTSGFKFETDSASQIQFPIGASLEGNWTTASGWMTRGLVDVSVTPVTGDKEVTTTVQGVGLKSVDTTKADFADDFFTTVRFGVSAHKDDMTIGANLGVKTSDSADADVTFGVNFRMKF